MSFFAHVVGNAPNGHLVELHDPEPENGFPTFAEAASLTRTIVAEVKSSAANKQPNTRPNILIESIRGNVLSDDIREAKDYGMEPSPGCGPTGRGALYGLFL